MSEAKDIRLKIFTEYKDSCRQSNGAPLIHRWKIPVILYLSNRVEIFFTEVVYH